MSILDLFEEEQGSKINGVVIGIVTNNKDPKGIGRIKVKFPWREDSDESYWARIATLMAGKDRGTYFIPEVGDEVLVSFDHGDIHHPYIIGALWNGIDPPPASNTDGKNDIRKIKSRSGHEIIFTDTDGQEMVEILTQSGHKIILDDTFGKERIEIKDKTDNNFLVIDTANKSMKMSSEMKLSIESNIIEIKAGATLTLQGNIIKIN